MSIKKAVAYGTVKNILSSKTWDAVHFVAYAVIALPTLTSPFYKIVFPALNVGWWTASKRDKAYSIPIAGKVPVLKREQSC